MSWSSTSAAWYTWSSTGAAIGLVMIPFYHYLNHLFSEHRLLNEHLFKIRQFIDLHCWELNKLSNNRLAKLHFISHEKQIEILKTISIPDHLTNHEIKVELICLREMIQWDWIEIADAISNNPLGDYFDSKISNKIDGVYHEKFINQYEKLLKKCRLSAKIQYLSKDKFWNEEFSDEYIFKRLSEAENEH